MFKGPKYKKQDYLDVIFLVSKLMKMLPESMTGGIQISDDQNAEIEHQMKRTEAIIDSMTKRERADHRIIDAGRKTRIANGSGTKIADVNGLLKQYEQMKKMMQQMSKGGLLGKLAGAMGGGGLGGLLGGGMPGMGGGFPGFGGGFDTDASSGPDSLSKRLKKKKRHKKR